ncbi:outer membrane protein [Bartonella bilalgolemii]|uniref:Outer membrane beta-barrel protein n=1 Tax=Bartonella bilalgolemii TaxID=2942911 RepID=A0ABT0P7C8_9HYPH|nr:outer membrane beta-barrel protein [Bartonella sp. G70]MCL6229370.1 outer membrane beta-barrel protein [Bartonella sp. G70]
MNIKVFMMVSILVISLTSKIQAADIVVPSNLKSISAPVYSWEGFYLGGQMGSFSSSAILQYNDIDKTKKWNSIDEDFSSEFSGITGGFYAGFNFDLGNRVVLGVDTDIVFSNKKDTKVFVKNKFENFVPPQKPAERGAPSRAPARSMSILTPSGEERVSTSSGKEMVIAYPPSPSTSSYPQVITYTITNPNNSVIQARDVQTYVASDTRKLRSSAARGDVDTSFSVRKKRSTGGVDSSSIQSKPVVVKGVSPEGISPLPASGSVSSPNPMLRQPNLVERYTHTLKQEWIGTTRIRLGLSNGRVMPYIAGGIAYTKIQGTFSKSIKGIDEENTSSSLFDSAETMIGYTLGGGFDFAVTDHILLRSEYRYSDFGEKKFNKINLKYYKTNDFRVGLAYKF